MKKESYFKRIKEPMKSVEDAKPIRKETLIYLLISLAAFVLFSVLGATIDSLETLFFILALIAFIPTAYFGIILYCIKRSIERFKNLHCECGAELVNDENTSWKEVKREWSDNVSKDKAEAKLYVTVRITSKCPKCGKVKTFDVKLCSGKIFISDYANKDMIVSTQSLVDDYFAGMIHG